MIHFSKSMTVEVKQEMENEIIKQIRNNIIMENKKTHYRKVFKSDHLGVFGFRRNARGRKKTCIYNKRS